jgi:hypothetical protein
MRLRYIFLYLQRSSLLHKIVSLQEQKGFIKSALTAVKKSLSLKKKLKKGENFWAGQNPFYS